jgi:nitrile hydratase accessory protein
MTDKEISSEDPREGTLPADQEPTFEAPWQARSFAIAVALSDYHEGEYSWQEFQKRLVDEIKATDVEDADSSESVYYEQWLRALERLVIEEEFVDTDAVRERIREFAAGDRDASEFIDGEHNHDHADGHEHEHEHGEN